MAYQEFQPHPILKPYIDAYWLSQGDRPEPVRQRIYPDGCIDIILNLGGEFLTDSGVLKMKSHSAYLVGTMTRYKDTVMQSDTVLIGIRFKPLGFTAFFKFPSLHEITEKTIDFNNKLLPEIHRCDSETIFLLNKFFCDRFSVRDHSLFGVIETINRKNGIISIEEVAKKHFTTGRQLERKFRQYLGISPKEYANFMRYRYAFRLIKKKSLDKNLLDIALDSGFYDHAHLTNEVKKYSGLLPSQL